MKRWKNLSAFWAAQSRYPETEHSRHGIGACRDAFGSHEPNEEVGNPTFLVPVACLWLIHSIDWIGTRMLGSTEQQDHDDWATWKRGLKNSRDIDDEDEFRTLIDTALAEMERAEQRMAT